MPLAHGSSPYTRLMPTPTTCPKPTRGEKNVWEIFFWEVLRHQRLLQQKSRKRQTTYLVLWDKCSRDLKCLLFDSVRVSISLNFLMFLNTLNHLVLFLQFQSDRHSSVRKLWQTIWQVAHRHRGDVWLCRGVTLRWAAVQQTAQVAWFGDDPAPFFLFFFLHTNIKRSMAFLVMG